MSHKKTHERIFQKPTLLNVTFAEAVGLLRSLGADVDESRRGSRVNVSIANKNPADNQTVPTRVMSFHKPHPGKELKRYQIEEIRDFLQGAGYDPAP